MRVFAIASIRLTKFTAGPDDGEIEPAGGTNVPINYCTDVQRHDYLKRFVPPFIVVPGFAPVRSLFWACECLGPVMPKGGY